MKPRYKKTAGGYSPQIFKRVGQPTTGATVQNLVALLQLGSEEALHKWFFETIGCVSKGRPSIYDALNLRAGSDNTFLRLMAVVLRVPIDLIIGRIRTADKQQVYWLHELEWLTTTDINGVHRQPVYLRESCKVKTRYAARARVGAGK